MHTPRRLRSFARETYDLISFFVFVLGIMLFVRFFILNPFTVIGSSMKNTIHNGDLLIINKRDNYLKNYHRGDIVVFVPEWKQDAFIKRIVGLPGETVKIQDNNVTICKTNTTECRTLDEQYLDPGTVTHATCNKREFVIEKGFFVLGDNRWWSTDSRCCFGTECRDQSIYTVQNHNIIGKASFRILPFNDITVL